MNDMYGQSNIIRNSDIRPEVGMHYETGLKHISGDHSWKLALFKSNVKDFITNLKMLKVKMLLSMKIRKIWALNYPVK